MELLDFLPSGISCVMAVVFVIYMHKTGKHFDDERANSLAQWNSMIEVQKTDSRTNTRNIESLIASFNRHMDNIVAHHKSEKEMLFKLHERNTSALEALAFKLTQKGISS